MTDLTKYELYCEPIEESSVHIDLEVSLLHGVSEFSTAENFVPHCVLLLAHLKSFCIPLCASTSSLQLGTLWTFFVLDNGLYPTGTVYEMFIGDGEDCV